MANAIQRRCRLIPVEVAPCAREAERILDAIRWESRSCLGLIRKVAGDFAAALPKKDADQRLCAGGSRVRRTFDV